MSGINIRDIKWGPQVPCHPLTNKDIDDWERDVLLQRKRGAHAYTGLKKPLGTGPVTAVTGVTGPARFRFRAVQTGAKFKF